MADSYELTVQVDVVKAILGAFSVLPAKFVGTNPVYALTRLALANGDNTITIPSGATYCLIIPDPTSTTTKKLKGAGGDTGVNVGIAVSPILFPLTGASTLIINSSALDATVTQIVFF